VDTTAGEDQIRASVGGHAETLARDPGRDWP
jgi:hypothetical protein